MVMVPDSSARRLRFRDLSLLDILVDPIGERQLVVDGAGVRVTGVRADQEVLLLLPLEDALAPRRVVTPLLNLQGQRASLVLVGVAVLGEPTLQFVPLQKVVGHHCEGKPPVVADLLSPIQSIQQVVHHRALPQIFNGHGSYSFLLASLRVRAMPE
jgi:hypothetical protein